MIYKFNPIKELNRFCKNTEGTYYANVNEDFAMIFDNEFVCVDVMDNPFRPGYEYKLRQFLKSYGIEFLRSKNVYTFDSAPQAKIIRIIILELSLKSK